LVSETPSDLPVYYANQLSLNSSLHDFVFSFGLKTPQSGGDPESENPQCIVYMSPQHAKVTAVILMRMVEEYEGQFGEMKIPEPPVVSKVWKSQEAKVQGED